MQKIKGISSASYWYITLFVVLLAGSAATTYAVVTASQGIKESLMQRAESMAELIPASGLASLKGDESDLTSPEYQKLKQNFLNIRRSNNDTRFIYVLALRDTGKEAFFYVDSEPPESDDYSPPGQPYEEGLEDAQTSYAKKRAWVLPIERDRWGVWLSAFSPILNSDGTVAGIFGMDVPADHYYRTVALTAALPVLLTLIVLMGVAWARRHALNQQKYLNEKAFYLSFASHEIVSPLTSVTWAIRYRRDNLISTLPKIENTISEVLTTVNEVLSLQNLDRLNAKKLKKEPEQISTLLDTLITNLSIVCEQHQVHIENQTAEADKAFTAPVDKLLFKRVLFNLLVNAIKYSPRDGMVTTQLTQTAKNWSVTVHNDSPSLSAEEQKRIFEGFYRTKSAESSNQQGIGLGLMLSHNIITRHGGTLEVESAENQGVTLKITLPKN
ncbi:MAG TPA: ATP-binding protein [Candidatus Saccharimonadales bacterium]